MGDAVDTAPPPEEPETKAPAAKKTGSKAGKGRGKSPSSAARAKKIEVKAPGEWVRIHAGTFTMGSPEFEKVRSKRADYSRHQVTLTHDFLLQATEVTQGQMQEILNDNPSYFTSCGANCPAEMVNWVDAMAYCLELSEREGLELCYDDNFQFKGLGCKGYRLPTEAEWEYAARAGTTTATYNGDLDGESLNLVLDPIGWFSSNAGNSTHPVKQKQPNAWGLYDVLGNVAEWVWDRYGPYPSASVTDPTGPDKGLQRVYRGGFYRLDRWDVARRGGCHPGAGTNERGFRPARSIP